MPKRTKTVLFLGAGASCAFGLPDTKALLPKTLRFLAENNLFADINEDDEEETDARTLRKVLRRLLPGWTKRFDNRHVPPITELLSLVDYSLAEDKPLFPGQRRDELYYIRDLLVRAIYEVIWEANELDERGSPEALCLDSLCGWIHSRRKDGIGIITTNYDTCIEQRLFKNVRTEAKKPIQGVFDFGFSWLDVYTGKRVVRSRPEDPELKWYKLHGSLNWARCPACEHIFINTYGDIAYQAFRRKTDYENTCHCANNARLQMHIVAPSMYRTVRDPNLLEVWKNALQMLVEADRWVIVGYSLPAEDLAIRSMMLRAYHARQRDTVIEVVQLGDEAHPRYDLIFGDCRYHNKGLAEWIC